MFDPSFSELAPQDAGKAATGAGSFGEVTEGQLLGCQAIARPHARDQWDLSLTAFDDEVDFGGGGIASVEDDVGLKIEDEFSIFRQDLFCNTENITGRMDGVHTCLSHRYLALPDHIDSRKRLTVEMCIRDSLYTDDACTYQFYERRGFHRAGERRILLQIGEKKTGLRCFLYSKTLRECSDGSLG